MTRCKDCKGSFWLECGGSKARMMIVHEKVIVIRFIVRKFLSMQKDLHDLLYYSVRGRFSGTTVVRQAVCLGVRSSYPTLGLYLDCPKQSRWHSRQMVPLYRT